jgi:hypothetical protein
MFDVASRGSTVMAITQVVGWPYPDDVLLQTALLFLIDVRDLMLFNEGNSRVSSQLLHHTALTTSGHL